VALAGELRPRRDLRQLIPTAHAARREEPEGPSRFVSSRTLRPRRTELLDSTRLCMLVPNRSVRDPGRQVEDVGNLSRVVVDVEIGVTDKPVRR
jgi:hypothetical protein